MSIHNSLKLKKGTGGHRNVLTRLERLGKLEEDSRWNEAKSDSMLGIPKVRSIKVTMKKKKKVEKKD